MARSANAMIPYGNNFSLSAAISSGSISIIISRTSSSKSVNLSYLFWSVLDEKSSHKPFYLISLAKTPATSL